MPFDEHGCVSCLQMGSCLKCFTNRRCGSDLGVMMSKSYDILKWADHYYVNGPYVRIKQERTHSSTSNAIASHSPVSCMAQGNVPQPRRGLSRASHAVRVSGGGERPPRRG